MLRKIFEKAADYLDTKLAILKLNMIEKIALIMGFCMLMIFGMSCAIAILIIMGMGLSHYFSTVTGSVVGGYFITVGIYIVLMLLAMLMKKPLLRLFAGMFVDLLTGDIGEESDEEQPKNE